MLAHLRHGLGSCGREIRQASCRESHNEPNSLAPIVYRRVTCGSRCIP